MSVRRVKTPSGAFGNGFRGRAPVAITRSSNSISLSVVRSNPRCGSRCNARSPRRRSIPLSGYQDSGWNARVSADSPFVSADFESGGRS